MYDKSHYAHSVTYWKNWREFSFNEGYKYRMKFPWVNACLSYVGGKFYISVSFKDHVVRFAR